MGIAGAGCRGVPTAFSATPLLPTAPLSLLFSVASAPAIAPDMAFVPAATTSTHQRRSPQQLITGPCGRPASRACGTCCRRRGSGAHGCVGGGRRCAARARGWRAPRRPAQQLCLVVPRRGGAGVHTAMGIWRHAAAAAVRVAAAAPAFLGRGSGADVCAGVAGDAIAGGSWTVAPASAPPLPPRFFFGLAASAPEGRVPRDVSSMMHSHCTPRQRLLLSRGGWTVVGCAVGQLGTTVGLVPPPFPAVLCRWAADILVAMEVWRLAATSGAYATRAASAVARAVPGGGRYERAACWCSLILAALSFSVWK